jgi:hypothetical protein
MQKALSAERSRGLNMARVRVMYWKEIPVQVQAEDATGRVSRQLEDRFQQAADTVAMQDGSQGTDEYLDAWGFGPYEDHTENAADAAEAVARELENMPVDFVKKVIDMQRDGTRKPVPGAIDHWALG